MAVLDPHAVGPAATLGANYLPRGPGRAHRLYAGEIAQYDFWFPDITLPVGFGQVRTATQLPVLTIADGRVDNMLIRIAVSSGTI